MGGINNYYNPGNWRAHQAQNGIRNILSQCGDIFTPYEMSVLADPYKTYQDEQIILNGISRAIDANPGNYREVHQGANELRAYLNVLDQENGGANNNDSWGSYNSGDVWPFAERNGYRFTDRYNQWCNYFQAPDVNYGWGYDDCFGNNGWDYDDSHHTRNVLIGAAAGMFLGGLFASWLD